MPYEVRVKKKLIRSARKFPEAIQALLEELLRDLEHSGPWQPSWPNYSKLGPDRYHCHLNYDYVACWTHEKDTIIIEVYYAGSRQSAPY